MYMESPLLSRGLQTTSTPSLGGGSQRDLGSLQDTLDVSGINGIVLDNEVFEEEDVQDERWTTVANGNEDPSVMGGGETEDLYCDDELHPSLENDPNMQLSCAAEAAAAGSQPVNEYPARPILHDRGKKQS